MNADGDIFTGVSRNNLGLGIGASIDVDFSRGNYDLHAAKQHAESVQYWGYAERNQAILQAVHTYFDLQAAQIKQVFLQNMAAESDTLAKQLKIQVGAGLRYPSEYLLAMSNYNHLKIALLQAETERQQHSAVLIDLLNLQGELSLVSADTFLAPIQLAVDTPEISVSQDVIAQRPEYRALQSEVSALQIQRNRADKGFFLPRLRAGVEDGPFGAFGQNFGNTFQINVAAVWTLPLDRLTTRGELQQWDARLASGQNQLGQFANRVKQEVRSVRVQSKGAEDQMAIAREALQLSGEALRQSLERQKLGTVKPFEVFQAQQIFLQAQLDYLNAVIAFNKAQFALKVALGGAL
jgi:outer membrane protein TolC